jgi:hypothetical protein
MANRSAQASKGATVREKAELVQRAASQLVRAYIDYIGAMDEADADQWSMIVSAALKAGLGRDQLAEAFACSAVTIGRWSAGQNVPGPMTRKVIKRDLIEMLERSSHQRAA